MVLETPFVAALNHVLRTEAWAREKLAPFAGEVVAIRAGPLPALRLRIEPGGLVGPGEGEASLTIEVKGDAPAALLKGEDHFLRAVEVTGNARLADAVMALARHLRWDYEEDLSRLTGDVVAHRVGEAVRGIAAWAPDAGRRFSEAFAAYAAEEAGFLLDRPRLEEFKAQVAALRDGVERLEARLRRHG
jgi:ubiquinone biosynthesis protein UbiJ